MSTAARVEAPVTTTTARRKASYGALAMRFLTTTDHKLIGQMYLWTALAFFGFGGYVMLMLGNFLRECKVTERLVQASQNEIINIVTIFLGTSVGLTMQGDRFLQAETLLIILLGIVAFGVATAGGVIAAKLMNLIWRKNPVNPLIGSAGVSAVPMAARVSHNVGQKYDPSNYLLMHAMGPNVAGVIGTAVIAGYYIATLAK